MRPGSTRSRSPEPPAPDSWRTCGAGTSASYESTGFPEPLRRVRPNDACEVTQNIGRQTHRPADRPASVADVLLSPQEDGRLRRAAAGGVLEGGAQLAG